MRGIPEATAIILTAAERTELDGLARSTKTEHRLRQRARIVLLAAEGMASRAIGREVGCTTGTASKWRVRYAEKRLAGSMRRATGATSQNTRRRPANVFWRCWTAEAEGLCALDGTADGRGARRCRCAVCLALSARPEDRPRRAQNLVREQRPGVRREGGRRGWALHGPAGERDRDLRRRKALDPGAGAGTGLSETAERPSAGRVKATITSGTAPRRCSPRSRWPPAR